MKIISEPGPIKAWLVFTTLGRPVKVKAPDGDVAVFLAKLRGVEVSGSYREARA